MVAKVGAEVMLRLPPDASQVSQYCRVYGEPGKPAPRTAAPIKQVYVGYQNKSHRHHMDSNLQGLSSHQEPVDIIVGESLRTKYVQQQHLPCCVQR
jgi:hypothetical protein